MVRLATGSLPVHVRIRERRLLMSRPIPRLLVTRFEKAAERLRDVIAAIHEVSPEANLYLAEDTLHLMSGPSHDKDGTARQDRSVASVLILGAGGGAW